LVYFVTELYIFREKSVTSNRHLQEDELQSYIVVPIDDCTEWQWWYRCNGYGDVCARPAAFDY